MGFLRARLGLADGSEQSLQAFRRQNASCRRVLGGKTEADQATISLINADCRPFVTNPPHQKALENRINEYGLLKMCRGYVANEGRKGSGGARFTAGFLGR